MPTVKSYAGELAKKLQDYRAKGQKEASKHRPAPDSAGPDQHESSLKSEAEGWTNKQQANFDGTLVDISRHLVESRQKVGDLQAHISMLVSDDTTSSSVEAELAGFRPALVKSTEARLRAEADYNYYRVNNNIHEEAVYPESRWMHFGLVAVLALAETVVNAFFFENSQGLLGGFFVALAIAVLNLATAMGAGVFFRYQNLVGLRNKLSGWSALIGFILLAIFFNALFAAFRAQYQLVDDPTEPGQLSAAFAAAWPEAMLIFKLDPQFHDMTSFLLFGLGLILSGVAFYKGYTYDDKYPEHGHKDRIYKLAVAEELHQQELVRNKVKEFLHQRKAAVQSAIQEPSNQVGMLARRVADLTHARATLETSSAAVQRDFAMVIEAYRHANVAVRAVPPPAYFKEPVELSLRADSSSAEKVLMELQEVQNEFKSLADEWREQMHDKLKALQNDSSSILSSLLTQYLQDVAKEAEDQITRRTPTIHRVKAA